ncbi:MAG: type I restriction endonuclease [Halothece sp.]
MVQSLSAREINLSYLRENFGLRRNYDSIFFWEWQHDLPILTSLEKQELDRIQLGYFNLVENPPLLENGVKLAIISPILFVAGFYLSPYNIKAEQSISLEREDEGIIVEGRIDILILNNQFWTVIIESKQLSFSVEEALPQLLAYLLATPPPQNLVYGMVTNGADFQFVKLERQKTNPEYSLSDKFFLGNQGKQIYQILQILKKLAI